MRQEHDLPRTVKLTDAARAAGVPPGEFRTVLQIHNIPVLRATARRERLLESHFEALLHKIAGPAVKVNTR